MHKIEKKYLLKESITILLDDLNLTAQEISEFYTVIKVCKEVKFRKIDSKYFKKTKHGVIGSTREQTQQIKKASYLKHKKNSVGKKVARKRYLFPHNEHKFSIDKYHNSLKNLYILEIAFKNRVDYERFKLPEIFKEYLSHEVTHDKRYQKRNLALLGNPKKNPYNIYTIFKDIELARTTNLKKTIFNEMKTSDSIRIILYKLFIELRINQDLIVASDAKEGIKTFYYKLKKSIILLNEYKHVFDKKMIQNVKTNLKVIESVLKTYKDLHYIQQELYQIKALTDIEEIQSIQKRIKKKIALERNNIFRFFNTREFAIMFKQYEVLLKENNRSFLSIDAQTSIRYSTKYKIRKQYKKAIMKCNTYERCNDDASYKTINKSFKILNTLIEEFHMIVDKKNSRKILHLTQTISKEFTGLRKLHKKKIIIDTYLENIEIKPPNYQKLLKKIETELHAEHIKLYEKLHKNIAIFKKRKNLFK